VISIRWRAHHRTRSHWPLWAAIVAVMLSAASFAVVLRTLRPLVASADSRTPYAPYPAAERIAFVTPRAAPMFEPPRIARLPQSAVAIPRSERNVEPPATSPSDSGSKPPTSSPAVPAATEPLAPLGVPVPSTRLLPPGAGSQSPFSVRSGRDPFAPAAPPSPAERDSILADLSESFAELVVRRLPTRGERDSTAKEAMLKMRNTGRILIVPPDNSGGLITASIPLPFSGSGRSKARRARDRAAHDENRARLERLRQRADSMRRAREDSLKK